AARTQNSGDGALPLLGEIEEGRNEVAGQALVDEFVDGVVVGLDAARRLRRWRPGSRWQTVQESEELFAEVLLQSSQIIRGFHGREPGPASLLLLGRQFEDLLMNVGLRYCRLLSANQRCRSGDPRSEERATRYPDVHWHFPAECAAVISLCRRGAFLC